MLDGLRQNPRNAEKEHGLGRLLNVLVNVCHALGYAHSRRVVHRDLKPANIMIGDFGEVYVMDWGLAKVLQNAPQADHPAPVAVALPSVHQGPAPLAVPVPPGASTSTLGGTKVVTSRTDEADLTQDGAVLGTPVYMPPEQAAGKVAEIDERSDIYSLGAILYEVLTLEPPIDKGGGYLSVLVRVIEGQIIPPEQRSRLGKIPRELAAIAMKALAKNPADRYPSVEALRRDIERFQEGRSVSAKEDTKWEHVVKFVKRNRAFSATTCVSLLVLAAVLGISFSAINNARLLAESANAKYLAEQEAKRTQAINSVPTYLRAARLAVNEREFPDALVHVDTALEYQPKHTEARLLKGQLLIIQQQFSDAARELNKYLDLRPQDRGAVKLLELCRNAKRDHHATQLAFAVEFSEQNAFPLADGMLRQYGMNTVEARRQLLGLFQKQIDAAWPGLGSRLTLDSSGRFKLNFAECEVVSDLKPLERMPLTSLHLFNCGRVRNLEPLKDMPLTVLNLHGCGQISDLTPLKGMKHLTSLDLSGCGRVSDLSPLKELNLTTLYLHNCTQVSDRELLVLKDMPLSTLYLHGCTDVTDLTPLQGMNLTRVTVTPKLIRRGMDVLRRMISLKFIGIGWEAKDRFPAEEFWKRFDDGEFNR